MLSPLYPSPDSEYTAFAALQDLDGHWAACGFLQPRKMLRVFFYPGERFVKMCLKSSALCDEVPGPLLDLASAVYGTEQTNASPRTETAWGGQCN